MRHNIENAVLQRTGTSGKITFIILNRAEVKTNVGVHSVLPFYHNYNKKFNTL